MEAKDLERISFGRRLVLEMDLHRIIRLSENTEDIQTLSVSKQVDLSRIRDRADICLIHCISEFYQGIYETEYNRLYIEESQKAREKQNKGEDPLSAIHSSHFRSFRGEVLRKKLPDLITSKDYVNLRKATNLEVVQIIGINPFASGIVADLVINPFEKREIRTNVDYQKGMINLYTRAYATQGFG